MNRSGLVARLANGSVTLMDVRTEDEFALDHIPGDTQIDLSRLDAIAATLDPAVEIIARCP